MRAFRWYLEAFLLSRPMDYWRRSVVDLIITPFMKHCGTFIIICWSCVCLLLSIVLILYLRIHCVYKYQISLVSRLYGCLRLACGWILWHARAVDDGRFRKHICEALFVCYVLQALSVMRAQFTDRHSIINWTAILLLTVLASAYGSFRFRRGGNLIKIYELPNGSNLR